MTVEQVALGFIQVANEVMVRPIREISVMRGFDIKEHVLAVFGGAGPQHACAIARSLGISDIFVHRFSGILSAYGIGMADVVVDLQKPASARYQPQILPQIEAQAADLRRQAEEELLQQGFAHEAIDSTVFLNLRYQGTDTAQMIAWPPDNDFARVLRETYLREFGFDLSGRDILIDDVRVRARGMTSGLPADDPCGRRPGAAAGHGPVLF
jgi:5-oxoprolinase (ATP-hydrolysing)